MSSFITSPSGRFRLIAAIEGISFLVLLGIAMPLKYMYDIPWMVQKVGMLHGVFFILYILSALQCKRIFNWSGQKTGLALLLSVIPFGTFYVVRRMTFSNS